MENSSYSNGKYHLQELSETQYQVAKGDPDIRGWDAVDVQNLYMGRVTELLYDAEARKVRYAVLNLQDNQAQLTPKQVLVPVGMTEVRENDRIVVLSKVTPHQLEALPAYEKGHLNQQVETKVLRVFAGEPSIHIEQESFNPRSASVVGALGNEPPKSLSYPKQVAFETTFKETDLGSFSEGSIELRERREEPILHTTPFVIEELVIGKEVEVHEETIYETIKKTEVEVDKFSNQSGYAPGFTT